MQIAAIQKQEFNYCFRHIAAVDLKSYALESPLVIGNESVC
jgi:hypothetical protein